MNFDFNKLKEDIIKSRSFTSPIWEDLIKMSEFNNYLDNNEDIKNFRNNISIGLDNSNIFKRKSIYNKKLINLYNEVKKIISFKNIDLLYDNILGDPYYEKFEDKIITFSSLEFAVYFDYIEKNVDFKKIDIFLEIGAGLGMFARNLKIKYPHIKYINVDLPHSNYVFYKNLTNYFEEKMFNTNFETNKNLNDFNLLNCWEIELLQNKSIDFAINMRSFMEMDMSICNYYLDNLRKKLKNDKELLLINRVVKKNKSKKFKTFYLYQLDFDFFRINKIRNDFFKSKILIIFLKFNLNNKSLFKYYNIFILKMHKYYSRLSKYFLH